MEFVRNALAGLSGVSFTIEAIEAIEEFLDSFGPLFDPAASPRHLSAAP